MQKHSQCIRQVGLLALLGFALVACADGVDDTSDPQVRVVESVEVTGLDSLYPMISKSKCRDRGGVIVTDSPDRKACKLSGGTGDVCVYCEAGLVTCVDTMACIR